MRLRGVLTFLFAMALITLVSCGDEEGPTTLPDNLIVPPVPTDLRATLGEDEVRLSWDVASLDDIASFGIYRSDEVNVDSVMIADVELASYDDDGLVPGRAYTYRVSSIGVGGVESALSGAISVTPGTYALVINDRAEYSNSRNVTLTFTIPDAVAGVIVANDSLFTGSFYEDFATTRTWLLEEGDGTKSVFARFRTADGTVTDLYRDQITLDTHAEIVSLSESSGGSALQPGDTLVISLDAGEAGGEAFFSVGDGIQDQPLPYDHSSGFYRRSIIISPDLVGMDAVIVATFTDRAGNVAPEMRTSTSVVVEQTEGAPEPVTVTPGEAGPHWIALDWTANEESDFSRYIVYRGSVPSVEGDDDDLVIAVITDSEVTSLVDSLSLTDATTYYYRIFVEDSDGLTAKSNEVSVATTNIPPVAIELFEAVAVDSPSTDVRLTWSSLEPSTVHDFSSFAIYRSTSEAVSDLSDLIGTIRNEIGTTSFVDPSSDQATTYYYRIYVVDEGGLSSGSNIASATTTDLDPSFVSLAAPTVDATNQNVTLTWGRNDDSDFASYALYWDGGETEQSVSDPDDFDLFDVVNNAASTSYAHYPEITVIPFYVEYFLETVDISGNRTRSNIVQVVFGAQQPVISNILVTEGPTSAAISFATDIPTTAQVNWSPSVVTLDRVAQSSAGLSYTHTIPLTGLAASTPHYFQIKVTSEGGVTAFSTIGSFTIDPVEG